MSFALTAYENEYLPAGGAEVNAVLTVAAEDVTVAAATDKAVVLIIDTSGSMSQPASKIRSARRAIATAVQSLPDGTWFAVVAGANRAACIYPPPDNWGRPILVRADERTRAEAVEVAGRLGAQGGTAISTWLDLARQLYEPFPGTIRLAYLLTDGRDESEKPAELRAALSRCSGVFQCDARGVGADWEVDELRLITSALLGEVDIIRKAEEMEADFTAFLERAAGKSVANVRLRVWTPQGATVKFLRQVSPTVEDLTKSAQAVNALTADYPTGAWAGTESRDYHLCVAVPAGQVGEERLAARVSVMVGDDAAGQALVKAVWTDDEVLSTRINDHVAHYTGQAELAQAIQEGLSAKKQGDDRTATVKLGRAVQLAHQSGNDGTVRLLQKVVDVVDPEHGTVRLKRNVEALDEMELDTRSTRTVRVRPQGTSTS